MGWRVELLGSLLAGDKNRAAILTLTILFILASHFSHAQTPRPGLSEEGKHRISQVENYIREQSLHGLSLLPQQARTALSWVSGDWHHMGFGQETGPELQSSGGMPDTGVVPAQSGLMGSGLPISFASNFHHKGFLPTHDAMLLGVGLSQNLMSDKFQVTARPFYGQSWKTLQGYWGTELALNISQKSDALPWGKIAVSLIEGNSSLTDHGTGLNLHGDVDLTNGFKFTAGLKQNSSEGDSDYVLVRWGLTFK